MICNIFQSVNYLLYLIPFQLQNANSTFLYIIFQSNFNFCEFFSGSQLESNKKATNIQVSFNLIFVTGENFGSKTEK